MILAGENGHWELAVCGFPDGGAGKGTLWRIAVWNRKT
jgi:hypothetical protein